MGWLSFPLLLSKGYAPTFADNKEGLVRVLIKTDLGDIEVELETKTAPITTANFLKYVDGKFYDGGQRGTG
jgi:peptidyl-prolyl cis-trans isomerase A (cyclophilin A)